MSAGFRLDQLTIKICHSRSLPRVNMPAGFGKMLPTPIRNQTTSRPRLAPFLQRTPSRFILASTAALSPSSSRRALAVSSPMPRLDQDRNDFNRLVLSSGQRLAMPIATYPGLALTGAQLLDVVTNPQAQVDIQSALRQRYRIPFVMSAMDLSAEAEAFGSAVHFSPAEVPTITGRLVTSFQKARDLPVPDVGTKRTRVYLEAVRGIRSLSDSLCVLGGSGDDLHNA